MPQQNVFYCFACDKQVLSYHLRSELQLQAFRQLSYRFAKYRHYALLSPVTVPRRVGYQDAAVQTDQEDVVFVSEEEAKACNVYLDVQRPKTLQDHFMDVQRQNQEIILRQQE